MIIYAKQAHIHSSGHAQQEELKLMLNLTKPQYFIPVHGEHRHLYHHAQLAREVGISKENIFITPNGVKLELSTQAAKVTDQVPAGKILIDGLGVGDIKDNILKDRQSLADDGIIIIELLVDNNTYQLVSEPDVISKGFSYLKESQTLLTEIKSRSANILEKNIQNNTEEPRLKSKIKHAISNYIYQELRRKPIILPLITQV